MLDTREADAAEGPALLDLLPPAVAAAVEPTAADFALLLLMLLLLLTSCAAGGGGGAMEGTGGAAAAGAAATAAVATACLGALAAGGEGRGDFANVTRAPPLSDVGLPFALLVEAFFVPNLSATCALSA